MKRSVFFALLFGLFFSSSASAAECDNVPAWSHETAAMCQVLGAINSNAPASGGATSAKQDTGNTKTSFFADTTTALGSLATYTGTSHSAILNTGTSSYTMFGASFYADQAGTAYIDESTDGSTWFEVASVSVTAGSGALSGPSFGLNARIRSGYYRVRFVNGSVAESTLRITSSFTAS